MDGQRPSPLPPLPPELILRITFWLSPTDLAALTRISRAWHHFIDSVHQDAIYFYKTKHPRLQTHEPDFSFLRQSSESYSRYFDNVKSWKDLCKRQTFLQKNWESERPITRESILTIGRVPVWRFRPDHEHRFIMSTSQAGGIYVTDMDTGQRLWSLSNDTVRPYAHLEYSNGWACWDKWRNKIEVWKRDESNRGHFERQAIISHDVETMGFMLSFPSLCVVSTQGKGFVYDISEGKPKLQVAHTIPHGAVGHITQNEKAVMYSLGSGGYHVYSKTSSARIGIFRPDEMVKTKYHIAHTTDTVGSFATTTEYSEPCAFQFPPSSPTSDRAVRRYLEPGERKPNIEYQSLHGDEWGAGLFDGNKMIGLSRNGRLFVCSDWEGALKSAERAHATTAIVECQTDPEHYDMGGWLSIMNNRVLVEVRDNIYVIKLDETLPPLATYRHRPSILSLLQTATKLGPVPVSFMQIFEDHLMYTYATFSNDGPWAMGTRQQYDNRNQFLTKAIRVVSFAPDLDQDFG